MKIVLCVVVIMLLVGVKLYVDRKNYKKRMRKRLLREWGSPIEDEYSTEKLQAVAEYYRDHEPFIFVDDITWNDLDMNRVYQQMNHTKSAMGQEYLYYLLRCPVTDPKELEERERKAACLPESGLPVFLHPPCPVPFAEFCPVCLFFPCRFVWRVFRERRSADTDLQRSGRAGQQELNAWNCP